MDIKQIMLSCAKVNKKYMRLPAGKVAGLEELTALYKRIAEQCLQCAKAWVQEIPCPDHEPATDAFAWGVVAWADAIGIAMGVDPVEWGRIFMFPHEQFAQYLKPGSPPAPLEAGEGSPADVIMSLDAQWTELVIRLTAQWGSFHHLKDNGAMLEAQNLVGELRNPGGETYKAFLASDQIFFDHLFKPFQFSELTRNYINAWLKRAGEVV